MTDPLEERVRAAINAGTNEVPGELLERIRTSRADGMRAVVPVNRELPGRLRAQLVRGAIAAMLALAAFGAWSRLSRPRSDVQKSPSAAGFGFPIGGDFGFGEMALAQGPQEPKFPPMTFDPSRLRQISLRYRRQDWIDGKSEGSDTISYAVSPSATPDHHWVVVMARTMGEKRDVAHMTDTLDLDRSTLSVRREIYRVTFPNGLPYMVRWTFDDRVVARHSEMTSERHAPELSGTGSDSVAAPTSERGRSADHPVDRPKQSVALRDPAGDTTVVEDTVYTLPASSYPRLAGTMNYGSELVVKLMAAQLIPGWKRSAVRTTPGGSLVRGNETQPLIPLDLELVGGEHVNVDGVDVDCWKILRRGTAMETAYFVRKYDGVTVKITIEGKSGGNTIKSETVLIAER